MNFKNHKLSIIYFLFGIIALSWTIWSTIHDITNWPKHHIVIHKGSEAAKYINSSSIGNYVGNFTTFLYFTSISNFLFSAFTLARVFIKNKFFSNDIQIVVSVYMTITLLVFWLGLSYIVPWSDVLLDFEQIFLHLINPILSILIVLFFLDKSEIMVKNWKKRIYKLLLMPAIYYWFLWLFYLAISGDAALYPFTNFYRPFLYSANTYIIILIDFVILIFAIFLILLIGKILYYLPDKRLNMKKNS